MDTVRMEVDLPEELAAFVAGRAKTGSVTPGEVMGEALQALQAQEHYMRRMVAEADADPRPFLTPEELRESFRHWDGTSVLD